MTRAYYNENDPVAAHLMRNLIFDGVIAPGDVDTRSIKDVRPDDLAGYTQCHFFAGGGLWSVAARAAGWPDARPLWTGSCPCQPFSAAGKGGGADDPRHLWPDLYRLVSACRPPVVMGEQVAGAAGYGWFDGVRADLAREDYASRAVDIPACAVDGPHQRNRLYWIAVDDGECARLEGQRRHGGGRSGRSGEAGSVAPADGRLCPDADKPVVQGQPPAGEQPFAQQDARSFWAEHEWIISPVDGKARRTQPGLPFLVDGVPGRVDLWRICGNAISPVLAAEVIRAFLETE